MDGKGYRIPLAERYDFGAGLLAGTLFGEDKFAAGEVSRMQISSWFGEQEGDLDGEDVLAVEVLVEAIIVAGLVLEEEWSRTGLAC